jgi:hypothetical protein
MAPPPAELNAFKNEARFDAARSVTDSIESENRGRFVETPGVPLT